MRMKQKLMTVNAGQNRVFTEWSSGSREGRQACAGEMMAASASIYIPKPVDGAARVHFRLLFCILGMSLLISQLPGLWAQTHVRESMHLLKVIPPGGRRKP